MRPTAAETTRRWGMLAMLLSAAALPAAGVGGQTTSPAPSSRPVPVAERWMEALLISPAVEQAASAVASAQRPIDDLDRMHPAPGIDPPRVEASLKAAMDAIDAAERKLAEANRAPPPLPAIRPAPKQEDWNASFDGLMKMYRCQLALLRGEAHLSAAQASAPGSPERAAHLAKAIETFKDLRVDHREVPLAMMAYIFECRAQRLAGKTDAALTALEPILKASAPSPSPAGTADRTAIELTLLAKFERLQIRFQSDPAAARQEALAWRASPELKGASSWQGRIDWLLARADAEGILASPEAAPPARPGDLAKAAEALRTPAVTEAAPPTERLAALARLDGRAGGKLLTREESLEWAKALAGAGHPDAAAFFDRALHMPGPPLGQDVLLGFVGVLWKEGLWVRSADVCDRLLTEAKLDAATVASLVQLRGMALAKAYWQEG